jgi:hypothetical protein
MAYCEKIELPGGVVAFVRFAGKRPERKKCSWCDKWSTKLCDYRLSPAAQVTHVRTCDQPMCDDHATNVGPNRDLCPDHKDRPEQKGLFP